MSSKNNSNQIQAMIDLETLSTRREAIILTIGAVKFNLNGDVFDPLYLKPDVDEQTIYDRHICENTLQWWKSQGKTVAEEAFSEEGRISLNDTLNQLSQWLKEVDLIWGQGYGFDMNILESLYENMEVKIPWEYWKVRDSRTLLSTFNIKPGDMHKNSHHNALEDARHQAICVQTVLNEIYEKLT